MGRAELGLAGAAPRRASTVSRVDRVGEVLNLVRTGSARTLTELAASMGLARSTVGQRVDRLVLHGLLRTADDVSTQRGRPPTVLEFNADAGVVLVAHLGMSGARAAATDLSGTILADAAVSAPISSGPETVFDRLEAEFDRLLGAAGRDRDDVLGIGIGLPGAIELSTARPAGDAAAPSWDDYPIASRLSSGFGAPTLIDNDLNALALGEQRACWPDADVLLCLKVGTVIGCGIVVCGQAVRGAQSLSGEIGHTWVPGKDAPCLCGNVGCLNAVAGGGALAAALSAQGLPTAHASDVARLAREGVPAAVQAVRAAGRDIGEVLAGAVNLLNPGVIAVWGYLAEAEEPLFAGIRETVYRRSLPAATRTLQLVRARLGDNAGVRGAAMMVIDDILAPDAVDRYVAGSTAIA